MIKCDNDSLAFLYMNRFVAVELRGALARASPERYPTANSGQFLLTKQENDTTGSRFKLNVEEFDCPNSDSVCPNRDKIYLTNVTCSSSLIP